MAQYMIFYVRLEPLINQQESELRWQQISILIAVFLKFNIMKPKCFQDRHSMYPYLERLTHD
eukprot:scaffold301598_cov20-Prasinocladus_malaysianus.AAC.1